MAEQEQALYTYVNQLSGPAPELQVGDPINAEDTDLYEGLVAAYDAASLALQEGRLTDSYNILADYLVSRGAPADAVIIPALDGDDTVAAAQLQEYLDQVNGVIANWVQIFPAAEEAAPEGEELPAEEVAAEDFPEVPAPEVRTAPTRTSPGGRPASMRSAERASPAPRVSPTPAGGAAVNRPTQAAVKSVGRPVDKEEVVLSAAQQLEADRKKLATVRRVESAPRSEVPRATRPAEVVIDDDTSIINKIVKAGISVDKFLDTSAPSAGFEEYFKASGLPDADRDVAARKWANKQLHERYKREYEDNGKKFSKAFSLNSALIKLLIKIHTDVNSLLAAMPGASLRMIVGDAGKREVLEFGHEDLVQIMVYINRRLAVFDYLRKAERKRKPDERTEADKLADAMKLTGEARTKKLFGSLRARQILTPAAIEWVNAKDNPMTFPFGKKVFIHETDRNGKVVVQEVADQNSKTGYSLVGVPHPNYPQGFSNFKEFIPAYLNHKSAQEGGPANYTWAKTLLSHGKVQRNSYIHLLRSNNKNEDAHLTEVLVNPEGKNKKISGYAYGPATVRLLESPAQYYYNISSGKAVKTKDTQGDDAYTVALALSEARGQNPKAFPPEMNDRFLLNNAVVSLAALTTLSQADALTQVAGDVADPEGHFMGGWYETAADNKLFKQFLWEIEAIDSAAKQFAPASKNYSKKIAKISSKQKSELKRQATAAKRQGKVTQGNEAVSRLTKQPRGSVRR